MNAGSLAQRADFASEAIGARAARHLDRTFRTLPDRTGATKNEHFMRMMTGEPHPMGNIAIVSNARDLDVMEAALRPLVDGNVPAAVVCVVGVDETVARHVVDNGFVAESMPAMVVDIERMTPTTLPAGYRLERIGASEEMGWTEALATGYPIPSGLAKVFAPEAVDADVTPNAAVQFFAILRDGRAVATSMMVLADGLAGIYCVATLPDERGKGLGAHVTAEPLRRAHRLGYRIGVLQSSTAGHGVYLRLGFEDRASVPMFIRMP